MKSPEDETTDPVYSNFDHKLDFNVIKELEDNRGKLYAQHAAWDFSGRVWCKWNGRELIWYDQVWRYHVPVATYESTDIEEVIDLANEHWGMD